MIKYNSENDKRKCNLIFLTKTFPKNITYFDI